MNKTKIEWADYTWNPVTGCLHGCPYCYARTVINRFGNHLEEETVKRRVLYSPMRSGDPPRTKPYPFGFEPTLHLYKLDEPIKKSKGVVIFVGSMTDLFGYWVPDNWIEKVFKACREAPQHTYLFLTKNPDRYCMLADDDRLPKEDNFWYGTTVTKTGDSFFDGGGLYNTFLSIEPLMESLDAHDSSFFGVKWIIIGAMTGSDSKHHQPKREWIENIVEATAYTHAAVFMKDSLKGIAPVMLRQTPPQIILKTKGGVEGDGDNV